MAGNKIEFPALYYSLWNMAEIQLFSLDGPEILISAKS
jgi:hypothetical protein